MANEVRHPWFGWRRGQCALSLLALTLPAAELPEYTSALFSGAGNCAFCHDRWGKALTDKRGRDVSTATDWRATMMAHSFRDPFWRAAVDAEAAENPGLRGFIEDKCQTCHAPLERTQARANGTNELALEAAAGSPLAAEGVGCTLCHQIQAANLGAAESFTGRFTITGQRHIFGPYADALTMPMRRHVEYTPVFGAHIQESALCATCHTLFTPILAADGQIVGQFPEQTPYLEWRNSDYARLGRHCQDCHMPRLDEAIQISSRPPWLDPRKPFWRHQFAGGNAFMLSVLAKDTGKLPAHADSAQIERMIAKTREQLSQAANLRASGKRQGGVLTLRVEVQNLTGHKFPTGHPYRRAWLHVRLADQGEKTLFESGALKSDGKLTGEDDGYSPHYDLITNSNQAQVYQAVMGDAQSRPTWSLLRAATYLKDNRLPPKGFRPAGEGAGHVRTLGVESDSDFHHQANGCDVVTYRIPLARDSGPVTAEVELLYQSAPPAAVNRLNGSSASSAREFARLYAGMDQRAERVQAIRVKFR